jgi:two-component system CheB/CheR fusion protein
VRREADRILVSRYVPAGVVVDEHMEVLEFRGRVGPYLEPRSGAPTTNLLRMVRDGLLPEVRAAFQRARREGAAVRREGARMRTDGHTAAVSVEVIPFFARPSRARLYLVLFDANRAGTEPPKGRRSSRGAAKRPRRSAAERELAATKEYLQTIIEEQEATNEELTSAHEELLSSNEELQSTNEELETAKEELQSSNEELSTVNDELHARNDELHGLNTDLAMLLSSIHLPMVILDAELRVRRATPLGERLLHLDPADVGRRVTDLRPDVDLAGVDRVVREVIESVSPRDVETKDAQGRRWSMRVRPHRSHERGVDGVVITWVDRDGPPETVRSAARGVALALLGLTRRPSALLSADLRVDVSNDDWRRLFPDPAAAHPAAWADAGLLSALRDLAAGGPPVLRRTVSFPTASGGNRTLEVGAQAVRYEPGDVALLLVVESVS